MTYLGPGVGDLSYEEAKEAAHRAQKLRYETYADPTSRDTVRAVYCDECHKAAAIRVSDLTALSAPSDAVRSLVDHKLHEVLYNEGCLAAELALYGAIPPKEVGKYRELVKKFAAYLKRAGKLVPGMNVPEAFDFHYSAVVEEIDDLNSRLSYANATILHHEALINRLSESVGFCFTCDAPTSVYKSGGVYVTVTHFDSLGQCPGSHKQVKKILATP